MNPFESPTHEYLTSSLDPDPRFASVIDTFLAEFPPLIERIDLAVQQHDADRLAKAAHQLKGASGSAGFDSLAQLALQIEQFGRTGQIDSVQPLVKQLQHLGRQIIEKRKPPSQANAVKSTSRTNLMKSLIVEDEFTIRKLMQLYLMEFGPCHIAKNGKEAVDAFSLAMDEGHPYDLICMDIMMPEMDGIEALQRIRQIEVKRNILGLGAVKVIMTTAKGQSKDIFGAFNSGCEAYMIKPFHREELLDEIGKLGLLLQVTSR